MERAGGTLSNYETPFVLKVQILLRFKEFWDFPKGYALRLQSGKIQIKKQQILTMFKRVCFRIIKKLITVTYFLTMLILKMNFQELVPPLNTHGTTDT